MTTRTRAQTNTRIEPDAFDRQVEAALELVGDPLRLGERSPLAAPYFLGTALSTPRTAPHERGETLRLLLLEAAAGLDPELRTLLQITWFARNPRHDNVALALALHLSDRTFYRTRNLAIKALAQALQRRVSPAVRLDRPVPEHLVGRAGLLQAAAGALAAGRSVYLVGPSGVGKSTLAAALLAIWDAGAAPNQGGGRAAFWYPLRERASDHAVGLLFLLAWWLHTLDPRAGNCWRQLVADPGIRDLEQLLAVLRFDLEILADWRLLFCIDDADVLGEERLEHAHILRVLEVLRGHGALLLNGQRQVVESDETLVVQGLGANDAATLFAELGAPLPTPQVAAEVVAATRGHPAQLRLLAALARDGDDLAATLADLARTPSFEAIFQRIWRRLSGDERALALQLAVFQGYAPADAFTDQRAAMERLGARGLLADAALTDAAPAHAAPAHGVLAAVALTDAAPADAVPVGVALLPHVRALFLERVSTEEAATLHALASDIVAARAEYTRAAEHAAAARQPALALWLWYANRRSEIERGQAPRALEMLRTIAFDDLTDATDRHLLRLARAELHELAGRPEDALADLTPALLDSSAGGVSAYARLLGAQAHEMAGRIEQALQGYRSAVELYTGQLAHGEVRAHLRLSFLHMYRRQDASAARREAVLARAKADAFLGDLEIVAGNYAQALDVLQAADAALDGMGDDWATRARVHTYLSTAYARTGDYAQALASIERALDCDRRTGDAVGPLYLLLNQAWVLKEAGRLDESEAVARQALEAAGRLRDPYLLAGLEAGVAEACLALGQADEAERHAVASLQHEEEFFRAPACVVLAILRLQQGRRADAEHLLQAALENCREIGDRATEATAWRDWGRALYARQDPAAAEALAAADALFGELGMAHEVAALRLLS